jgi:peptidoglycan-associated lipoprotein
MRRARLVVTVVFALAALAVLTGCPPKFPNCKTDEHCKEAENNEGKLVCILGQCQECGRDEDCPAGKICKFNKCEVKPQCLADADCTGGLVCRAQKCVPECTRNEECGANMKCEGVRCVPALECSADADCKEGKVCENNKCIVKVAAAVEKACDIVTIHFEFDKYEITSESRSALEKNADCMKQKGVKNLVIEGNCDERGTTEYNMSLGLNRANAAKKFLQNLGVKNVKAISYGKERPVCTQSSEDCWYKNRRADFATK